MNAHSICDRAVRAVQRRASRWLGRRIFVMPVGRPIISFTFDDFPRTALLNGAQILKAHGLSGTFYASLGLAGGTGPSGEYFVPGDIEVLLAQGHEIGCHTFDHHPAWNTDAATYEQSVERNAAALRCHAPGAQFRTHSYPLTYPHPDTKVLLRNRFNCCRGAGQRFNIGRIDLNSVDAFFIERCRGDRTLLRNVLVSTISAGGWLIFATHDVAPDPSPFGCTCELFEHIAEWSCNSGAEILPVNAALELLRRRSASRSIDS